MGTRERGAREGLLTVELEDAAARSLWTSVLGLLSSQTQQWHFVGQVGGRAAYRSPTFAAPYSWGTLPLGRTMRPRREWAPDMDRALEELRAELAADGWVKVSQGDQPWREVYQQRPSVPVTDG